MKPIEITESEYQTHMARIEALMLRGSEHLTEAELVELRTLSLLAQSHEQQHYALELLASSPLAEAKP